MSEGLKTTFEILAATDNEAAVGALIPALDSPHPRIQNGALRAILRRRSPAGGREVLRRLDGAGPEWRQIISEYQGRMSAALRDAVLSADPKMCANGCQAILWFGEFELMPALITAAEDQSNQNANLAARTLLELAELLYEELSHPRDYHTRRDPQLIRQHVTGSLELSIRRFAQHKRTEIVEACLLLVNRDNSTLKQILKDPHDQSYLAVVETLKQSPRPGIIRLVLSFLEDPHAPSAAIAILAHRTDEKFLGHLMRKVGFEPSVVAAHNLKRIEHLAWLRDEMSVLDKLNDEEQHGTVQMVLASGVKRLEAFNLIKYLLCYGKVGGRRAAAAALASYSGGEANTLALRALEDEDPRVQAHALGQLRQRGIPGAMTRLIKLADSPHEVIREAVRQSLGEFSFVRFLGAFDLMDEEVRKSTGALVKKIDPQTLPGLVAEMESPSRTRRLRAIDVAIAVGVVGELEGLLVQLLRSDDHIIRTEAARALEHAATKTAQEALGEALHDRSVSVREAAQQSLNRLTHLLPKAAGPAR